MKGLWLIGAAALAATPVAVQQVGTDRLSTLGHSLSDDLRLGDLRSSVGGSDPVDYGPLTSVAEVERDRRGPQPLWVPTPTKAEIAQAERERRRLSRPPAAPVTPVSFAALAGGFGGGAGDFPGGGSGQVAVAHWLARGAAEAGLPPQLPVMASLVESGLRNLALGQGDRDSIGLFQMRESVWDKAPYEGYGEDPALQLQWFVDRALAVRADWLARGGADPVDRPASWGAWIADVERPAAQFRGRYQLRLEEASALLAEPAPAVSALTSGALSPGLALDTGALPGAGRLAQAVSEQVLASRRITLSPGAQEDLRAGRIDPRVGVLLLAVAQKHSISISVFQTGHSYLTAGGSVSNHSVGRAADISVVDGRPVSAGNAAAKRAAFETADLPAALRPTELGAPWLLDLPGAFTNADHQDHLHVGWDDPLDAAGTRALERLAGAGTVREQATPAPAAAPAPVAADADPLFVPSGTKRKKSRVPFDASAGQEATP